MFIVRKATLYKKINTQHLFRATSHSFRATPLYRFLANDTMTGTLIVQGNGL
jgi:hypothetical protein